MFTQLTDLQKAAFYYAVAFGLCLGTAFLAPYLGDRTPVVAMFIPLAAVLLMLLAATRDGYGRAGWLDLGVQHAGVRGWGLALVLPLFILGFAYGSVWVSGLASLVVPNHLSSVPFFVLDLVGSIVVVALFGGLGEEIGWRGYLLPHLKSLGLRRAMFLSGLLHGLWHLPILIGTPYYHAAGSRVIIVPLFLLTLTMAGICYGYLRVTTGSVWPAAIAHSTFNILWDRFNSFTVAASPLTLEYLAGESGLLTLCALTVVAGWLAYRLTKHMPNMSATTIAP